MRNPYRWSFDRANGDMWIGDVGGSAPENDFEEIDHLAAGAIAGANLGWNCLSGNAVDEPAARRPSYHRARCYTYPSGPDVVIGGYVVRDPALPAFAGRYLFGRLNTRRSTGSSRAATATTDRATPRRCRAFGEDGAGHLYATSLNGAGLPAHPERLRRWRLRASAASPSRWPSRPRPGDTDRLFVVEKTGHVEIRQGGAVSDVPGPDRA